MVTDISKIKEFVCGYEDLCNKIGVYMVFELPEFWLEYSGEQLDIDEAVQRVGDVLINSIS